MWRLQTSVGSLLIGTSSFGGRRKLLHSRLIHCGLNGTSTTMGVINARRANKEPDKGVLKDQQACSTIHSAMRIPCGNIAPIIWLISRSDQHSPNPSPPLSIHFPVIRLWLCKLLSWEAEKPQWIWKENGNKTSFFFSFQSWLQQNQLLMSGTDIHFCIQM